jgi:hypothetical protein
MTVSTKNLCPEEGRLVIEAHNQAAILARYRSDGTGIKDHVAVFNQPWATDSTGADVPTWYEVEDSKLTQHVDTRGFKAPIIFDPQPTSRPIARVGTTLA